MKKILLYIVKIAKILTLIFLIFWAIRFFDLVIKSINLICS